MIRRSLLKSVLGLGGVSVLPGTALVSPSPTAMIPEPLTSRPIVGFSKQQPGPFQRPQQAPLFRTNNRTNNRKFAKIANFSMWPWGRL